MVRTVTFALNSAAFDAIVRQSYLGYHLVLRNIQIFEEVCGSCKKN